MSLVEAIDEATDTIQVLPWKGHNTSTSVKGYSFLHLSIFLIGGWKAGIIHMRTYEMLNATYVHVCNSPIRKSAGVGVNFSQLEIEESMMFLWKLQLSKAKAIGKESLLLSHVPC